LQSPREENKQPAARRSSKNAIYEPLSILKPKRFKPYLTTTPLQKFDFFFKIFLKTNILAAKNQKNTFLFLKKIT